MAKYKVGDELIVISDPTKEKVKLRELTTLTTDGDYAQISWGLKIIKVEFEKPYVTLTYRNVSGELNKVFAECKDIANFDEQMVLEKALLKAFTNEIINISVVKNNINFKNK